MFGITSAADELIALIDLLSNNLPVLCHSSLHRDILQIAAQCYISDAELLRDAMNEVAVHDVAWIVGCSQSRCHTHEVTSFSRPLETSKDDVTGFTTYNVSLVLKRHFRVVGKGSEHPLTLKMVNH